MTRASLALLFSVATAQSAWAQHDPPVELVPGTTPYKQMAAARDSLRQPPPGPDSKQKAQEILSASKYRDPGAVEPRELLKSTRGGAQGFFERLGNAIGRLIGSLFTTSGPGGVLPVPPWAWIGIVVLVVAGFVIAWLLDRKGKARLAADLIESGEEGLTADEWLERADILEGQGLHRDAFRCLYVALLVRLSEFNIAPFRRYETNWEHVRRAEQSPRFPEMLDLRGTTRHFDEYWYGRKPIHKDEVAVLRSLYIRAYRTLEGRAA